MIARSLLIILLAVPMLGEAALLPGQYEEGVNQLLRRGSRTLPREETCRFIEWAVAYGRQGMTEREVARQFLVTLYQDVMGIDPRTATAGQRHDFTHFVNECYAGEGFLP